ncbi:hypothetical protein KUG88_08715 [Rhodococcus rhodochrous]|uniref:hypothetical protein n=1 Tax=Rhodococcus rhodochrous TaxID=1829 RepID=UPI001E326655|nr:hypothetical protein [Rhodococcus rhodochrous]MCB8910211.1 hypothetical protein [Rhodococcus rhodochrous]
MTSGQITTTIETLTAEVRAVMIGKRQITLSVYRQLDTIPWEDIEPFGRVRDKQDDRPGIYAVGRHRDTGVLSRASIHRDSWVEEAPGHFVHWVYHDQNGSRHPGHRSYEMGGSHGRTLRWGAGIGDVANDGCSAWRRLDVHRTNRDKIRSGEYCNLPELLAESRKIARGRIAELVPHELEYQEAKKLPLIVLAGLR